MAQHFKASSLKGGYSRNAGRKWRAGDVCELRQLVRRGTPLRVMSLKLGRPESAIRTKAGGLGLSLPDESEGAVRHSGTRSSLPVRDTPAMAPRAVCQLELFG